MPCDNDHQVIHNMQDDDDEEAFRAGMPTLSDHTILNSDYD